jgi:hypothetical protein
MATRAETNGAMFLPQVVTSITGAVAGGRLSFALTRKSPAYHHQGDVAGGIWSGP